MLHMPEVVTPIAMSKFIRISFRGTVEDLHEAPTVYERLDQNRESILGVSNETTGDRFRIKDV